MSRVYFHSKEETAELLGTERHYMGILCNDLTLSAVGSIPHAKRWLAPLLPEDSWALESDYSFRLWLCGGASSDTFTIAGNAVSVFTVTLNTAWDLGNDQVRLLARLHGQCEIHCWVDGPNRRWLSEIIRAGRKTNVLRSGQGWEAVANLLDSRDDGPVVCSYSVCEMFPNFECLPKSIRSRPETTKSDTTISTRCRTKNAGTPA